jgi:hypothetical protein
VIIVGLQPRSAAIAGASTGTLAANNDIVVWTSRLMKTAASTSKYAPARTGCDVGDIGKRFLSAAPLREQFDKENSEP